MAELKSVANLYSCVQAFLDCSIEVLDSGKLLTATKRGIRSPRYLPHLRDGVQGAGRVGQTIQCSLDKHGDMGSIPRTHVKKPGIKAHTCDMSINAKPGRFLVPSLPA